jgi:hypothetical protein
MGRRMLELPVGAVYDELVAKPAVTANPVAVPVIV